MTRHDDSVLRQYVLGTAAPEQAAAIEDDYFDRADALDRVAAVEDDLIDEYLSGDLSAADHDAFERHYLSTPRHRTRVAVARSLREAAAQGASKARTSRGRAWSDLVAIFSGRSPLGRAVLVAATVLLAVGVAWMVSSRTPAPETIANRESHPAPGISVPATPPAPRQAPATEPAKKPASIVVFTLSAIAVRSAGGAPPLRIPAGTDIVALRLEGDAQDRDMSGRAVVRTVEGEERWRGAATADPGAPATARVEVPADRLPPDDYIVELFGRDAAGQDAEKYRYVFRVRGAR